MIRRHPHVFGGASAGSAHTAYRHWQRIKRQEGKTGPSPSTALRKRLVAYWDGLRKARETATPPSARPGRRTARGRGPG
jgi:uncharacterized protein YabN with tetrapyrrole methylase and pyrophosphatase domain